MFFKLRNLIAVALTLSVSSPALMAQCRAYPETPNPVVQSTPIVFSPNASVTSPDIIGLTTDNKLLRFNSAQPGKILSETPISPINLQTGESIIAIDYSPSDGYLYGLGSTGRLYRVFENGVPVLSAGPPFFSNQGSKIGFDVDPKRKIQGGLPLEPIHNVIRVINDVGQHQLIAPDYGLVGGGMPNLAYAINDASAGRKPNVVALAYSNNVPDGASTTAYGIDSDQDTLVRLGSVLGHPVSPDTGQLFTVGRLGVDTLNLVGFDIGNGSGSPAYASLTSPDESQSKLFTINLSTGSATPVGLIGSGRSILDLAVMPVGYFTWNLISPATYCWITELHEADRIIRFTVTRTGNISSGVTLDYAPDNSTSAKEGHGVVGMTGRIYFAPGETSRNFTIFMTDDAAVWPGYLVIRLIKPTGGYVPYGPDYWEMEINDNDYLKSPAPNPIDESLFFVTEHYIDFLHREPDNAGFQFWQNQVNACGTDQQCVERQRINVSASFFLSIEFRETGFLVYRFYKAAFGRMPQFNEFQPDKQVMGQDLIVNSPGWEQQLEKNKVAFADLWLEREDFKGSYDDKTNAQYVDALIANTGVALSATERDALINGLDSHTETRATVLRKIAENQTFAQQEFNRAFVLMEYFGYLRRNPNDAPDSDFSGYDFWLNKLNSFNGDYQRAEMVKAFITSSEYGQRFGP